MIAFSPRKGGLRDTPFSVYDIETSTDLKRVYLVGWYNGTVYKKWESLPLPPDNEASALSQFCMWWFHRSPHGPVYAHNGGNFDHLYVLKWLIKFIPEAHIEIVPTQSSILLMTVKIGKRKYEFRDSMRLMMAGLDAIAKALLGKGKLENIDYETLHLDPRRYEYLKRDCVSLYDCLTKFKQTIETKLRGKMGLTAAATAIETLRRSYLEDAIPALSRENEAFVRRGYYGGRTEIFHKGGNFPEKFPLRCYDVNSMYPWALTQPLPIKMFWEGTPDKLNLSYDGFVECTVSTKNCDKLALRYPCLPYRQGGKLLFPLGRFRGVWTTKELSFALEHGYSIVSIGRVVYFKSAPVFREYMLSLYAMRNKSNIGYDETMSRIAKLLANATYGKFGTNREREKIHIQPPLYEVLEKEMAPLQGPMFLPVFVEQVQCEADYVLPHLAAWTTSLARVKLLQLIYRCHPMRVYYCDTDSVYTTALLDTSTELGGLKEEYNNIVRAEFIAPKVYHLTLSATHGMGIANGREIIKAKGFSQFARGFIGSFDDLKRGCDNVCSAFSKMRTVLRGDFGLMMKIKRLHLDNSEKRIFSSDGGSVPMEIKDE